MNEISEIAALLDQAEALLNNPISVRLAEGWYPSRRDPDTGNVQHDRHVLIWVRNYEALINGLALALEDIVQGKS